jgi:predicted  nucleic acid-binding Zn-ribbon protein
MTKHEQIKFHLTAIRDASAGSRLHAAAIEELLEPEPKAASITKLRKAQRELKRDLEQAHWDTTKIKRELTLKDQCLTRVRSRLGWIAQGLESHSVEEENRELKRELEVTIRSNMWLREQLAKREEFLRAALTSKELLREQISALQVTVAKLRAEIDKQNKYIQILKKGRVYARRNNSRRSL